MKILISFILTLVVFSFSLFAADVGKQTVGDKMTAEYSKTFQQAAVSDFSFDAIATVESPPIGERTDKTAVSAVETRYGFTETSGVLKLPNSRIYDGDSIINRTGNRNRIAPEIVLLR